MTQAIIYARFSPRRNEETCESIETQIELCRAYCARKGYSVTAEYSDRAMSGKDGERPGLWDALNAVKAGTVLVTYRLDRLARSVYLSHVIEQQVAKQHGSIESTAGEGTWDDSEDQWLVRKILQTLAEYERKVIGHRTSQAMRRHQKNGRRMSAQAPYGWKRDPDDSARIVRDEAEQQAIIAACEFRRGGMSYRQIARLFQSGQIPCRGKNWHHGTIRRIVKKCQEGVKEPPSPTGDCGGVAAAESSPAPTT